MIVVDCSAILDFVMRAQAAPIIEARLFAFGDSLHAPHLLDVEAVHVLRHYTLIGELSAARAKIMLDDFTALRIERLAHEPLLNRILAASKQLERLRRNVHRTGGKPGRAADHMRPPTCRGARFEGAS